MLVLNRRVGEKIVINDNVELVVLEVHASRVKLGFSGPPEAAIHRKELHRRITAEAPGRPGRNVLQAAGWEPAPHQGR